jgi:hypothetical protein
MINSIRKHFNCDSTQISALWCLMPYLHSSHRSFGFRLGWMHEMCIVATTSLSLRCLVLPMSFMALKLVFIRSRDLDRKIWINIEFNELSDWFSTKLARSAHAHDYFKPSNDEPEMSFIQHLNQKSFKFIPRQKPSSLTHFEFLFLISCSFRYVLVWTSLIQSK